jgi:hypothetical protein
MLIYVLSTQRKEFQAELSMESFGEMYFFFGHDCSNILQNVNILFSWVLNIHVCRLFVPAVVPVTTDVS